MSSPSHLSEGTVTRVLLALWRRPETTLQELLRETLAPLPDLRMAMDVLRERRCLIEQETAGAGSLGAAIRLVSTGLACWRDVLEDLARSEGLVVGRRVMVFFRTGSTNDVAWQCAVNPAMQGLVVVADEQLAGRGRLGHTWTAKPEQSLLLSVLLCDRAEEGPGGMDRLTLLAGLAAARGIEAAAALPEGRVRIKWPNDLLIDGRKLSGILAERRGRSVVIGVGVNVCQAAGDFGEELAARAISLYQATGQAVDRLRVAAAIVRELDRCCAGAPLPDGDWLAEWKGRCDLLGQRVCARTSGAAAGAGVGRRGVVEGQVTDIDPLHGLVVRDESGAIHFLSAPTTTLSPR